MPHQDFLARPTPVPMGEATQKGSPRVLEALAWHGLLEPSSLTGLAKGVREDEWGYHLTRLHRELWWGDTEETPAGLAPPTPQEWERARRGEEWDAGPQGIERLVLWACSSLPLPKDARVGPSLASLAIHQNMRFALHDLAVQRRWVAPDALEALLKRELEKDAPWGTGISILVDGLARILNPRGPDPGLLIPKWGKEVIAVEALDGLLQALPSRRRLDVELWQEWLPQWGQASGKNPKAFALIHQAVRRFGAIGQPTPAQQATLREALSWSVLACPASQVRAHARRLVAESKAQGVGVSFFPEVLDRATLSDLKAVFDLARRAAVCQAVLNGEAEKGAPVRAQQAILHWIGKGCWEHIGRQDAAGAAGPWKAKKKRPFPKAWEQKRRQRLEAFEKEAAFTPAELLKALHEIQRYEGLGSIVHQAAADWMEELSQTDAGWDFLSAHAPGQPSPAAQILDLIDCSQIPKKWLYRFAEQALTGDAVDPAVGQALFAFQCHPTVPLSQGALARIEKAWQADALVGEDPDSGHWVVTVLSALARRGLLDVGDRLDPDNLGLLGGLHHRLQAFQMNLDLPHAAPARKPSPRL